MMHQQPKCTHPQPISIACSGELYEVDPCTYEEYAVLHNATVRLLRCAVCGNEMVEWQRKGLPLLLRHRQPARVPRSAVHPAHGRERTKPTNKKSRREKGEFVGVGRNIA